MAKYKTDARQGSLWGARGIDNPAFATDTLTIGEENSNDGTQVGLPEQPDPDSPRSVVVGGPAVPESLGEGGEPPASIQAEGNGEVGEGRQVDGYSSGADSDLLGGSEDNSPERDDHAGGPGDSLPERLPHHPPVHAMLLG